MKILFISGQPISSNSSVTMMNLAYIKGFVEIGNKVKVITAKTPSNYVTMDTGFQLPKEVIIEEYGVSKAFNVFSSKQKKKEFKDLCISFVKNFIKKIYYKFSIYDSRKSWVNNARNLQLDDEYYDLIISSSDPKHSHVFAENLIKRNRGNYGKWVQLWGDPMYHDITREDVFLKRRFYKEEERLISLADKVIYVSPFTAEEQKKMFPKFTKKIDYVLIPYFKMDESLTFNTNTDKMIFGYYGDYYSQVRNLEPFYEAVVDLKMNSIIRGNSDKAFKSTERIDVGMRIPIKELEELEKKTDVFVHLCNLKGTQIPAKVYYYSGTRKPILFILDGETKKIKDFFSPYERYIFCENNKKSIIDAINKIKNREYSDKKIRIVDDLSPFNIALELINKIKEE